MRQEPEGSAAKYNKRREAAIRGDVRCVTDMSLCHSRHPLPIPLPTKPENRPVPSAFSPDVQGFCACRIERRAQGMNVSGGEIAHGHAGKAGGVPRKNTRGEMKCSVK
ncbi:hypothetical protein [Nevskia soli]|uniref:hypothetical protein n=1 Tax=Nevskia soli TaxID=418856 RepID=UPI0012FCA004|nr:hypothetical protein [Nevskia soli]